MYILIYLISLGTFYVPYIALSTLHVSHLVSTDTLLLFYKLGNWSTEKLSNLTQVHISSSVESWFKAHSVGWLTKPQDWRSSQDAGLPGLKLRKNLTNQGKMSVLSRGNDLNDVAFQNGCIHFFCHLRVAFSPHKYPVDI